MKKVLLMVSSLSTGGAERVVSNLSLNLSSKIKREIILFENKIVYPFNGRIFILKSNKVNIKFLRKIFNIISYYKQVKKIKKNNTGIPIISFLEYPNLINILNRKYGPTIVSVRNHMSKKHNRGLNSWIWKKSIECFYNKADKIIVVSQEIKKDLINNFKIKPEKIQVIYNSYDLEKIKHLSLKDVEEEYKHIFENPVLITVGRLSKQKGHIYLIRAFKKVLQSIPNANLVILGEGELESKLREIIRSFNLEKNVHLLGFKDNPFKYIAQSKLFILSSLYEGFPNALAEAMACGVPVMSTDCLSGPREILAPNEYEEKNINYKINLNRYGILIPTFNGSEVNYRDELTNEENIMADKIIKLLSDENLHKYFSRQALERVKNFNVDYTIKQWEELI